ncbi:MAG: ABC transporter ATP-binding protein [Cyanobacteriota bacterium]|jgi:ABC-2 type transport system ATP-binding protein|nr:ABC transporter ATP-binding protein [Cyanobacteriota bacterium]
MVAAVTVEHLKKAYGSVQAVEDVSLTIPAGEIFGLLGPNGAGKTTTIRCLCTLATPDSGRLEVMGIPVLEQPRRVRQYLGYIAQEVALDKVLTGRELMALQADLYHLPKPIAQRRMEEMVSLLDLGEWADQKTGRYSGGIKKRLDLALGLLHQPEVLVLDEPTVGLDIESRSAVWTFLRQLRATGTTVLITSHYLEEVDALADRVAIIDQGRVIASGRPTDLKDQLGGDRITLRLREFTTLAEAEQAQQQLCQLPVVQNVIINTAQGNSLNLVVDRQTNVLGTVQEAMAAAGLPIFGIAQSRPSLDDVYLAATGRTLMDAELAAVGQRDLKQEKKQAMKGG